MTTKINKSLMACVAIPLCSLFATKAQAVTTMAFLDQTLPTVTSYAEVESTTNDPAPAGEDFARFNPLTSPTGDVTSFIQLVPGNGEAGDFGGFIAGNIALIDRGAIAFVDKVANAEAAGAVGVLIANTDPSGNGAGVFQGGGDFSGTTIPALMIRNGLGNDLKAQMLLGDVEMHINVVPEPSGSMLALVALTGFGLFGRRRRQ